MPPLSRSHSLTRSRHQSLTQPPSRVHSRSRPNSMYSRYSDTDIDYDDNLSSAVSGTTLARALVSSYILAPQSGTSNPPSAHLDSRSRSHLARQDSATLPRGELPFTYNRKSLRSSKGSIAASTTGSTYWRDRRISRDQIVVVSPEDRQRKGWSGEVPPVPPIPDSFSPETSPYPSGSQPRSRRPSTIASGNENDSSAPLTAEWRRSNGARRGADPLPDPPPDTKRRRVSKLSEASASQTDFVVKTFDTDILSKSSVSESQNHALAGSRAATESTSTLQVSPPKEYLYDAPTTISSSSSLLSNDTPGNDTPALSHSQSLTLADGKSST
jgi:hypothetical protein